MDEKPELSELLLLRGILALMIDERARATNPAHKSDPVEISLSRAGLDHKTIAQMVGKKPDAVRMMINRNGSKGEA